MLKLYTANNSICTQKVLLSLAEKGLPYETRIIDLFTNEQYAPWYLAINPKGVVPALDHGGNIVIESIDRRRRRGDADIGTQNPRARCGAAARVSRSDRGMSLTKQEPKDE